MTDSKMPELLAKLEKLDWETYRKYRASMNIGGVILEGEVTLYLLQGVIQDAIAVHDWEYCVRGPLTRLATCAGDVITGYSEIWAGGRRIRTPEVQERDGQTPAEAILAAYVAALEAEVLG